MNPYDQFDPPGAQPAGANPYDQFDQPAAGPARDPGAWQNRAMEGIRQLALGLVHSAAHPIETAQDFGRMVYSAATLPGDVYAGRTDPLSPEGFSRTMGLAQMIAPDAALAMKPAQPARAPIVPSPITISPERQALLNTLNAEGVPVTAGQATGSRPLRFMESALADVPGGGGLARQIQEAQQAAFTKAALSRADINATAATPEVMSEGRAALGRQFDELSSKYKLVPDAQLQSDLDAALRNYNSVTGPSNRAPGVLNAVRDFYEKPKGGPEGPELAPLGGVPAAPDYVPPEGSMEAGASISPVTPTKVPPNPKAQSLISFLRGMGGIKDETGELRSMGLDRFPGLINRNGKALDKAREAAAQVGYLGPDTESAVANTTVNDLYDALAEHPRYTATDAPAVEAYNSAKAARESDIQAIGRARDEITASLNGVQPDPDMLERAVALHLRQGVPTENAYERAVMSSPEPAVNGARSAATVAPAPQTSPVFRSELVTGDAYQNTRSQLSKKADALRMSDPAQAQAYRDIRDALDAGMKRSISATDPMEAQKWDLIRQKYANYKALESAVGRAGENAALGVITPANLRAAIAAGNKRGAYVTGQGDLADLARAGVGLMSPLPNSGTAPRTYYQALFGGGGYLAGGLPGLLGGAVSPAVAGRVLMSQPVQNWLKGLPRNAIPAREATPLPPGFLSLILNARNNQAINQ